MKNLLFLRKYNNYYNRKVKMVNTLAEYLGYEGLIKQNINFSPEDGITSTVTVNWADEWSPDYAILFDDLDAILSRWFVLEAKRTRNGQFQVTLRRDVVADHFDAIKDAPIYVQKANLEADNPLIYNSEGLSYNQIKKSEVLLKDETNTSWIVGYVATGHILSQSTRISVIVDPGNGTDVDTLGLVYNNPTDITEGAKFKVITDPVNFKVGVQYGAFNTQKIVEASFDSFENDFVSSRYINTYMGNQIQAYNVINQETFLNYLREKWFNKLKQLKNAASLAFEQHLLGKAITTLNKDEYYKILQLNGDIVYSTSTLKYYKLTINTGPTKVYYNDTINTSESYNVSLAAVFDNARDSVCAEDNSTYNLTPGNNDFKLAYSVSEYSVSLVETTGPGEVSVTLKEGHNKVYDSPYDIFAMPFSEENLGLAVKMVEEIGKENIYDVQILPYCPARYMIGEDGIDLELGTVDVDYFVVYYETDPASYMLWAKKSSDSFIIPYSIPKGMNSTEVKVMNETEFYRLTSPNFSGSFDFNAAKNEGVDYFRVSYTYKPYTPYIQVAPNFKGLYGSEFVDARGLICGGDFSVSTVSDAWTSYELNNKNFQNIFDTQVKTMDFVHGQQMLSNGIGAGLSAVGMGVGAGLMTGNPLIGVGAGVASAAGGIADMAIGESIYQRQKQSQIDIFNYNLGNVKARPDTLNKISAFNINNKYFPFLEYYTATDVEKEMLRNKIKYEGMTVMVIAKIADFIGIREDFNFFKGQLIQVGEIAEDFHLADAVAVELEKGVYL